MNKIRIKHRIGSVVVLVAIVALAILAPAILSPSIATWQTTSFEIDQSLVRKVSIESQIRAIEKRNPYKDFQMHARDQNLFLYAVAVVDTKVIVIPGVDEFTSPFLFPVHVISGTGEQSDGARNDYLNRIARAYAETHNRKMYGYMVTW